MSAYLPRHRERLPSFNSDLVAAAASLDSPLPNQSVLIFPNPPSAEPFTPPAFRRESTSTSIPSSLIESVEGKSNPSHSRSNSSWEDVGRTASLAPLTRDRLAQLQTRLDWPGQSDGEVTDDVEVWEWSGGETPGSIGSPPSSFMHGRRPLPLVPPETTTEYESASSEFHFSTSSAIDEPSDYGSLFLIALRSRETPVRGRAPSVTSSTSPTDLTSSSLSPSKRLIRIPFESFLRFIFNIDPVTLNLLQQEALPSRPHPNQPPSSDLFLFSPVSALDDTQSNIAASDQKIDLTEHERGSHAPVGMSDAHVAVHSLRKGLSSLEYFPIHAHSILTEVMRAPLVIMNAVFRK